MPVFQFVALLMPFCQDAAAPAYVFSLSAKPLLLSCLYFHFRLLLLLLADSLCQQCAIQHPALRPP